MKMEEEDWKNIVGELAEQIQQLSIDRAVARADVRKLSKMVKDLQDENRNLLEAKNLEDNGEVQRARQS